MEHFARYVSDYGSEGWEFESLRARQFPQNRFVVGNAVGNSCFVARGHHPGAVGGCAAYFTGGGGYAMNLKDFFDLLVGIAWPATALAALLIFRPQLRGLLTRLKSAGTKGLEFDPQQQSSFGDPASPAPLTTRGSNEPYLIPEPTKINQAPRDTIAPVYRAFFDETVERVQAHLPEVVARFGGDRDGVLIATVAEFASALHLERAGRSAFRSQIEALDALKLETTLTRDAFRLFYDKAKDENPDTYEHFSFEQWFGFLTGMGLVEVTSDDRASITHAGRVLGHYLAERGYSKFLML